MRRSLPSYLMDIQGAIAEIRQFTADKIIDDYLKDGLLRAGVERKLSIVGEVLAQMRHHFPESLQPIEYAQQIIDFRNLLMHRYLDIDDTVV